LRAGHPEVQGLCLALADWSAELKILEALPWKKLILLSLRRFVGRGRQALIL